MIQAPSDTSHFLQPCDQNLNTVIKWSVKSLRDIMIARSCIDVSSVRVTLMHGVHGLAKADSFTISSIFDACGLWPMNFQFMNRFKYQTNTIRTQTSLDDSAIVSPRRTDEEALQEVINISHQKQSSEESLRNIAILLSQHNSVNKILVNVGPKVGVYSDFCIAKSLKNSTSWHICVVLDRSRHDGKERT